MNQNNITCIMGPTASGKTKLALELANNASCEIINVDSVNIYRGLDIGSAKPSMEERKRIPHHLVDIRDPSETYSAAEFCKDALGAIESILKKGKKALLVGGTMMYFRSLLLGLSELPSANPKIRKKILAEAQKKGWDFLHEKLKKIDPKSAKSIHPNDPQRLQRALEVFELTGKPLSLLQEKTKSIFPYPHFDIALIPQDRKILHQRIEQRFDKMIEAGFIDEVKKLYERGDLHANLPAIRSVGYRQVWMYLEGQYDFDTMREKAIIATRQLAKRQLTWLRHWPEKLHIKEGL